MTINPTAIKTPEAAIKAQTEARWKRALADQKDDMVWTGARFERLEADELDAEAALALDPDANLTAPLEVGRGRELIVETARPPTIREGRLRDTVRDDPDMIAARASMARVALADDAGVLAMTVDAADTMEAANSLERMFAAQLAALHSLTMKNAATAASFAAKAADPHGIVPMQERQIANVEAARSTNAAARGSEVYQRGMLTIDRLRNGRQQSVLVQHVNVGHGGQAVVAGAMKAGGNAQR